MKIAWSDVVAMKEMGYGESCRYIEAMHKREMVFRTRELKLSNRNQAEKAALKLGGEMVDFSLNQATQWTMVFTPIKNLKIYFLFQKYSPEFEDEIVTFYGKDTSSTEIPVDDLYEFTRLYANALVRTSQQRP